MEAEIIVALEEIAQKIGMLTVVLSIGLVGIMFAISNFSGRDKL